MRYYVSNALRCNTIFIIIYCPVIFQDIRKVIKDPGSINITFNLATGF